VHTIQHSVVSADSQMNASMTQQQLKVIKKCIAVISPKLQMGGSKNNKYDLLVITEHV